MRSNSLVPRGTIIFWQIFGTLFSVLGLIIYIVYMGQISDMIGPNQPGTKVFVAVMLSILFYFTWKSIYSAIVIIRYMQNSTDIEISNNRFMISALSLSIGGFFTPFVLTAFPNIPVQSTINPRIFISKAMGVISMVGSAIGIIVMFVSALTGNGALQASQAFDVSYSGYGFVVTFAIYMILFVFGLITVAMFYSSKIGNTFEGVNSNLVGGLRGIASIWLVVITIELFFVIFFAIVRLIGVIGDVIKSSNSSSGGFMLFLTILIGIAYIALSAIFAWWYVKMTVATIYGIWQKDGIHFAEYSTLTDAENRASHNESAR